VPAKPLLTPSKPLYGGMLALDKDLFELAGIQIRLEVSARVPATQCGGQVST
jgi:hypothetical protein